MKNKNKKWTKKDAIVIIYFVLGITTWVICIASDGQDFGSRIMRMIVMMFLMASAPLVAWIMGKD